MENTSLSLVNQFPKDKYTLLIPIETVAKVSDIQSPVINAVKISTNLDDKEIYEQDKKNHLYAITKRGLTKLAEAAGIKQVESKPVLPSTCQKCSELNRNAEKFIPCGQCPNRDVKYRVTVSVPQLTGETLYFVEHHEIRVEEATQGMSENQKKEFLRHLPQICEAKALNGAIRTALQIKGTYTLQELMKPFVVAYLVPNLDNSDVKKVAIESMFSSVKNLFGNGAVSGQVVDKQENNISGATKYDDVVDSIDVPKQIDNDIQQEQIQKEELEDRSQDFRCDKCDCIIAEKVWDYSVDKYGVPLCYRHQKEVKL